MGLFQRCRNHRMIWIIGESPRLRRTRGARCLSSRFFTFQALFPSCMCYGVLGWPDGELGTRSLSRGRRVRKPVHLIGP
jgi:hypothetical protein